MQDQQGLLKSYSRPH